jgi:hypothetical protein
VSFISFVRSAYSTDMVKIFTRFVHELLGGDSENWFSEMIL